MENKKDLPRKALGRGLSSLIRPPAAAPVPAPEAPPAGSAVRHVSPDEIRPNPFQPRKTFDEATIADLAKSIEQHGIVQPIVVRRSGEHYEIVAGERRWRAAKKAGVGLVPVLIQNISNDQLLEIGLIENIQREDLNAMDLANAYSQLSDDLGISHEEIAKRIGKDRASVTNTIRLLQLSKPVQRMVAEDQISAGHARVLLRIENKTEQQAMAERAAENNLSVRELEDLVESAQPKKPRIQKVKLPDDPNVKAALQRLEQRLGTRVRVVDAGKGRGKIEIEYYSSHDLTRIYDLIAGDEG